MVDANVGQKLDPEAEAKREFLKKAGKLAVTLPAVALLLSAAAKPAWASDRYGKSGHGHGYGHGHGHGNGHGQGALHSLLRRHH